MINWPGMSEKPDESRQSQEQEQAPWVDEEGRPLRFEQAVERLEAIVDRIESGEIGLEQSLAEYEAGIKLLAHCRGILEQAESRLIELGGETGEGEMAGGDEGAGGAPEDAAGGTAGAIEGDTG